jgi:SAM-dependent methyltransferase
MDTWKYFDITHREHVVCNPTSLAKLDELIGLLRLQPGSRVLEIACGKGELLVRLTERYGISGIGVDKSPYFMADAQAKHKQRVPDADPVFLEMDGADYRPESAESFDLTLCLGASWIFDGHRGTVTALAAMTKPGGLIVVGEPYWITEPAPEYLAAINQQREVFSTHAGNVAIGEALGLTLIYTLVSSQDDFDRYEGLQWYAANQYALAHPDDPDVAELLEKVNGGKRAYLTWGRDTLGWAIYVFRKPPQITSSPG